jgi:hypothetical protein
MIMTNNLYIIKFKIELLLLTLNNEVVFYTSYDFCGLNMTNIGQTRCHELILVQISCVESI